MQEKRVQRIDGILEKVEPVVIPMARRQRQTDTVVSDEGGITRQRRGITFAEVSEDQAA